MRQHKAVFGMLVRSSFYKICGLLFLMVILESILFWRKLERVVLDVSYGGTVGYGLETLIERSWLSWIFAFTFVLLSMVICYTGCEYGSRQGYTLRRLSISEKSVFWWQAFYNICCYFIFWAVQVVILYVFCWLYIRQMDPALVSDQTVFIAFYRSEFLHSLLPLREVNVWLRNLILVIGSGISAASFPYKQRRGKSNLEIVALGGLTLVYFIEPVGVIVADIVLIGLSAAIVIEVLVYIYGRRDTDED